MIRTQFKIHIQSSKMLNNYTRRLWLLCTAWMLCNVLQAQNLDRLEKLVDKARTPQERLDALKTLIDSSSVVDLARTATYVERMRDMAQRAGSDYHLGFVEEKTGTLSYKGGVLDSARVQYKRAYDHYWRAGKREDALLVYTRIGIMYSIEGRFDDAERIYANTKARAGNLTKVYAYLYNQLGTLYTYKANADSAGYYYTQSVKQYKLLNDTVGYLRPMYNHAWMLSINSKDKEAKTMAYTVLELQERMKAWEDASYTYGLLVNLLVGEGDYENALIYAEKNYNYIKIEKNSRKMMGALAALAQIKSASDNPAAGIPYLEEALAYAEESNEREAKEIALLELGQTYLDMGKFDRAKEYLTACLALTEDKRESYLAPTAMAHLGQAYYQTDQLKEAKHWLYQALDLLAQNQVTRDLPMVYGILASVHLTEKQPRLAIQMAEKAYSMAQEMGDNKTWFIEMTSTLYHAHKDVGDYQAALQYYEQHKQLSDTLYNVEKVKAEAKQLKDFEFKLEKETIAIEQQAREDKLKAKARQNAMIAGFIGLLALVSIAFFVNLRRQQARIRSQNEELTQLNSTKDRIFAIIGHDMRKPALAFRGMTQKINYLLQKEDYTRLTALGNQLEESAYSLNTVTDNLLNWALLQKNVVGYQPQTVVLQQVAEELQAIFATAARNKNIRLSILPDEGPQQVFADPLALRTILRNLIDNAIKYTPEGGSVSVTATADSDWVNIGVQDSGIGIPEAEQKDLFLLRNDKSRAGTAGEKGTGLGLHLAHELAKINKGVLALNKQIAQGTSFELRLPRAVGG
jgi:signal transduction histidine kinase